MTSSNKKSSSSPTPKSPSSPSFDLSTLTEKVVNLLQDLSPQVTLIQNHLDPHKIKTKSDANDLVTEADLFADQFLTTHLAQLLPESEFLTEETADPEMVATRDFSPFLAKPLYWIIDPIDGTGNYALGSPNYAISVALVQNNQIMMGAIARPAYQEIYFASQNLPQAYLLKNNQVQTLRVRQKAQHLIDAVVGLDATCHLQTRETLLPFVLEMVKALPKVRCFGSGVTNFCALAKGEISAAQVPAFPWDVAAGAVIITKAGGQICQLNGQAWQPLASHALIANCPQVLQELVDLAQKSNSSRPD